MSEIKSTVSPNNNFASKIVVDNDLRSAVIGLSPFAIGLGNVDDTSDADKPVSAATQTALDLKADVSDLIFHVENINNPHDVTADQIGLGNVDNTADVDKPISSATQTALDDKQPVGNYATGGGTATGTNTGDQTITLTNDVTGSGTGTFAATIANGAVSLTKMANVDSSTVFYRKTSGSGAPEVQSLSTLKTDLGLSGTNTGDQDLSGLVPYTGADKDVNIGNNNLTTSGTVSANAYIGLPFQIAAHGTDADFIRPIADVVQWIGSVQPNNSINNDLWINTA